MDMLELELIDVGCEELSVENDELIIYGAFDAFGKLHHYFEENQYEIVESGFDRIPTMTKKLTPEQEIDVKKLLDKMEDDDDVQDVYSTME